jgi:hypothetical protein
VRGRAASLGGAKGSDLVWRARGVLGARCKGGRGASWPLPRADAGEGRPRRCRAAAPRAARCLLRAPLARMGRGAQAAGRAARSRGWSRRAPSIEKGSITRRLATALATTDAGITGSRRFTGAAVRSHALLSRARQPCAWRGGRRQEARRDGAHVPCRAEVRYPEGAPSICELQAPAGAGARRRGWWCRESQGGAGGGGGAARRLLGPRITPYCRLLGVRRAASGPPPR